MVPLPMSVQVALNNFHILWIKAPFPFPVKMLSPVQMDFPASKYHILRSIPHRKSSILLIED